MLFALKDNAVHALQALRQNWVRSLLTMSGITVGMLSVVTLVAILQGVKVEVQKEVEGLGANLVIIVPGKLDESGMPNPMAMIGVSPFTQRDLEALAKVPGVAQIAPALFVSGTVEGSGDKTASGMVIGTNIEGVLMNPTPVDEGRKFEAQDLDKMVCILGAKQKEELFGKASALGKKVGVNGKEWAVIGVLKKPGADGSVGNAMLGLSELVYLPERVVRRELQGWQMNRIVLTTDYAHPAETMIQSINEALLKVHKGKEVFGVITQKKGLALVIRLVSMAQALLVLIAAISLFVAGVGIMNIMLVTVTERTREIGIRKTVGARQKDIFLQFLVEAIVLAILGGLMGLMLSQIICSLIAKFSPLTPILSLNVVAMGMALCVSVGAVFGVAPAVRASRLNPIDALRYE